MKLKEALEIVNKATYQADTAWHPVPQRLKEAMEVLDAHCAEERQRPKVAFLCDRRQCAECEPRCVYTHDVRHALNFYEFGNSGKYLESMAHAEVREQIKKKDVGMLVLTLDLLLKPADMARVEKEYTERLGLPCIVVGPMAKDVRYLSGYTKQESLWEDPENVRAFERLGVKLKTGSQRRNPVDILVDVAQILRTGRKDPE